MEDVESLIIRRMQSLLDMVEIPASIPEGVAGSLQRRAWVLGVRLRQAERAMTLKRRWMVFSE